MNPSDGNKTNIDAQLLQRLTRLQKALPYIRRLLLWFPVLVLAASLAYCQSVSFLNERGVCLREMRRIPDDELIRRWVEVVIKNYPPPDPSYRRDDNGAWISALQDYGEPIRYKDAAEFFALNPDCCSVTTNDPISGYMPSEDERSFGSGRGYVLFEYKLRYKTKNGMELFRPYKQDYPLNNCGEIWRQN